MYDIGGSLPGNNTIRRMLYMIPGNRRERSATALLPFYATCVYPVLRVWGYNSLMSCSELRGITYDRYAAAQMDPEDPAVPGESDDALYQSHPDL